MKPNGGYLGRDEYCAHTYAEHKQHVVKACSMILYGVRDGQNNYTGKNLLITSLGKAKRKNN